VAGFAAGAILTGGLLPGGGSNTSALASSIPRRLVAAAQGLQGYRATFDITELHWTRAVPVRSFVADVAFRAPEGFRVLVRDRTSYPSAQWPRNNLMLQSDGRSWVEKGPDPCPRAALPACPTAGPVLRGVVERAPFDAQTAMPTDVIVPMTVLAASRRADVIGPDQVRGRDAIAVQLAYQDATPLFDYLRFLGSWRPFFPQDRVVLWLDRTTWFPLRYEVFPAAGPERTLWAAENGLPREPAARPVFTATFGSLSTAVPPAELFVPGSALRAFASRPGQGVTDQGFRDQSPQATSPEIPPGTAGGLHLVRVGRFGPTAARPYDEAVQAYANGLAWLTVTRVNGWNQSRLFGVGPFAQVVALRGREAAYYEPASATEPRRVALHTPGGEYLVATNLPTAELLTAAASLPVTGVAEPASWRIHHWQGGSVEDGLTPAQAEADAGFAVLAPSFLPPGYAAATAEVVRGPGMVGVTVAYRRPAAELDGIGIRVYQATGQSLPPPTSGAEEAVGVQGVVGRWSPDQHLLEWAQGGVYRSVAGPEFDLATLLRVADSLRRQP
jgi:hypothetical protein